MRYISFCSAWIVLILIVGAIRAQAELLPEWEVNREVFQSELIIRGEISDGNLVTVKEVFQGPADVEQKLRVERLADLPRERFESARELWDDSARKRAMKVKGDVVLFLSRDEQQRWTTVGWGSGVKWLVDGKVYGYAQAHNPGPYYLGPDGEAKTEEDLRKLLDSALARKNKFLAAKSAASPEERVQALAEFVEPDRAREPYFDAARLELSKAGSAAVAFLIAQIERADQQPHRGDFLAALGDIAVPAATDYLLKVVDRAAPVAKAMPRYEWDSASKAERQAMADWFVGIYALAKHPDRKALPAFREAVAWGAVHWCESRILEDATRGLERLPDKANIAVLTKALSSIPADEYDWVAKERCVRALSEQRFLEVVPILAEQLEKPPNVIGSMDHAEYNGRIAHRVLTEIVGRDLGMKKQPWLKWLQEQFQ